MPVVAVPLLTDWPHTAAEAVAVQRALAEQVQTGGWPGRVALVAGVDVSVRGGLARAAVAVLSYPALRLEAWATATRPVEFPYVPGLLAFRELPVVLQALAALAVEPDLYLCDAQGVAHPRRLGLASHLGVLLDRPTIGCAKSRLCGEPAGPLSLEQGSQTPLLGRDGQEIGAVVRTRQGVRPLYVSVGHRVALAQAVAFTLSCHGGVRLPEPTRQAHRLAAFPEEGEGRR
ncbi:MAG: endonuclease V [Chloroflexi bacterium]|nr:endonuclease V [Chloroflexota bacterium]